MDGNQLPKTECIERPKKEAGKSKIAQSAILGTDSHKGVLDSSKIGGFSASQGRRKRFIVYARQDEVGHSQSEYTWDSPEPLQIPVRASVDNTKCLINDVIDLVFPIEFGCVLRVTWW